MTTRSLVSLCIPAVALLSAATAQGPATLLADANAAPTLRGSQSRLNAEASTGALLPNGAVLFPALRDDIGYELYTSFGLPGTSFLAKDIYPGPANSLPGGFFVWGNDAYFFATTPGEGRELWKSDGSLAGTVLVKDVAPGPQSSGIVYDPVTGNMSLDEGMIAELNGKLYVLMPGAPGLYETDGTAAGTLLVKQLDPFTELASTASNVEERRVQILAANNKLFFAAQDGTGSGVELWVSDGTTGGTTMVADINPGSASSNPAGFVLHQGEVYFRADDGTRGVELWKSDGTAGGTTLVSDIRTGASSSEPRYMVSLGTTLVFGANEIGTGHKLYKTDGTAGGTAVVDPNGPVRVNSLRRLGTECVFVAGSFTSASVYKTDGTTISQLSGAIRPAYLSDDIGGKIYFRGNVAGSSSDYEVYATDGGIGGATLVAEIVPGDNGWFWGPILFRETAFGAMFFADDGVHGYEPWSTDGTQAGTVLLDDINPANPAATAGSGAGAMIVNGAQWFGRLLDDGTAGIELWISDGTPAGTKLLKDIWPGGDSNPYNFQTANGRVFFSANDGVTGTELWTTDGTAAGTVLVADIRPGSGSGFSGTAGTGSLNGVLLFAADDGTHGSELWRSDGTAAGTFMVTDLNPAGGSFVSGGVTMVTVGNHVFFHADDGSGIGRELWKTDGTVGGTVLVADINPTGSSNGTSATTQYKAAAGGKLFFCANDGTHGVEPWVSDGTAAGTFMLADINPGAATSGSGSVIRFYPVGDDVYFYANDGTHGFELWKSDGTVAGTYMVVDLNPGTASVLAGYDSFTVDEEPDPFNTQIADLDGQAIFAGNNGQGAGVELWKSDGTAAGTVLVADIEAGPFSSTPNTLTRVGSRFVYFSATTTQFGSEIWRTDGTTAGTVIVADIAPGNWSGYLATGRLQNGLVPLRGRLLVAGYHPIYDEELFAIQLRATAIDAGYDSVMGFNAGRVGQPSAAGTGAGCAAPGALPPRLTGTDPVLGGSYSLTVTGADPNAISALWIGTHAPGAPIRVPFLLGDCPFFLDFAVLTALPFTSNAQGAFTLANIGVAASPGTIGLTQAAHALVIGPSGAAPLGIAVSNGVFLTGGF